MDHIDETLEADEEATANFASMQAVISIQPVTPGAAVEAVIEHDVIENNEYEVGTTVTEAYVEGYRGLNVPTRVRRTGGTDIRVKIAYK